MNGQNSGNETMMDDEVTSEGIQEEVQAASHFLGEFISVDRAGIIRPGIMVPKYGCPQDKINKYNEMVAKGADWDEMDAALGKDAKGKSWLKPTNVGYFTARACDCEDPEDATAIMTKYGDADGHLRTIPITLPYDDVNRLMKVSLSHYGGGGLLHTGKYCGDELLCETPVSTDAKVKTFGRGEVTTSPCDPKSCSYYQANQCKMRGGFVFHVDGVPGIGVWALYTSSWHSLRSIRAKLILIRDKIGRYGGTLSAIPEGILCLQKFKKTVGKGEYRKEQDLVTIESMVPIGDIVKLFKAEREKYHILPIGNLVELRPRPANGSSSDTGQVRPSAVESQGTEGHGGCNLPEPEMSAAEALGEGEMPGEKAPPALPKQAAPAASQPPKTAAGQKKPEDAAAKTTAPKPPTQSKPAVPAAGEQKKPAETQGKPGSPPNVTGKTLMVDFVAGLLKDAKYAAVGQDAIRAFLGAYSMQVLNKPIDDKLGGSEAKTLISHLEGAHKKGGLLKLIKLHGFVSKIAGDPKMKDAGEPAIKTYIRNVCSQKIKKPIDVLADTEVDDLIAMLNQSWTDGSFVAEFWLEKAG